MSLARKVDLTLKCILSGKLSGDIDDTLLQKFLTKLELCPVFQDSAGCPQNVTTSTQVLDYITEAFGDKDSSCPVLSFAFQLLSVLEKVQNFDLFSAKHETVLNSCLQTIVKIISEKGVSSSVRVSSLLFLSVVVKKEVGYTWIQRNNLIEYGWTNISEPSIFVQRSSENYLSLIFAESLKDKTDKSGMMNRICDVLNAANERSPYANQRVFTGTINFLASSLSSLSPSLLTQVNESLGPLLMKTFELYQQENETADKLNRIATILLNDSSSLLVSQKLSSCGCFVSMLKFSANLLLYSLRLEKGSDEAKKHLMILASPLFSLTNPSQSEFNTLSAEHVSSLLDALQEKVKCRRIISASVAMLTKVGSYMDEQLTHMVLKASLDLMQVACKKDSFENQASLIISAGNLTNCSKTLTALLAFQKNILTQIGASLDPKTAVSVFAVHVSLLQDVALPSAMFQMSCRILSLLFPIVTSESSNLGQLCPDENNPLHDLGDCLSRRLLDRQWEIVDSVVELCATLFSPHMVSRDWFFRHDLHTLLWDMLANENSEGYVRAACLKVVVLMITDELSWQSLKDKRNISSDEVGSMLSRLLKQDPEAFVQRAAIKGFLDLTKSGFLSSQDQLVTQTLSWAVVHCLDWEVKATAVECWQEMLQHTLLFSNSKTKQNMDDLSRMFTELFASGCLNMLACAVRDCDRPVRLLAAESIALLRIKVENAECVEFLQLFKDVKNETCRSNGAEIETVPNNVSSVLCERDDVMNMVVDTDMYDRITAVIGTVLDTNSTPHPSLLNEFHCWQEVASFLWQCDLDCIIRESSVSTDVYEGNLSSLLDDILAAVESHSNEEYQAIDCY